MAARIEDSASNSNPTSTERKKRKRSRKVCTACRQAKAKCDAADQFPNSCSRCVQNSTHCNIDPSFKRTRRRVKSYPQDLRSSRDTLSGSIGTPGATYVLGVTGLSSLQAAAIFDVFFERYHPSCPLFLHRLDPAKTYETNPFLFWSIVVVAGRTSLLDAVFQAIYPILEYQAALAEVRRLATEYHDGSERSIGTVQGMLLLAEWGFPSMRPENDCSWFYINSAVQMGYLLGLHRPYNSTDFCSRTASVPQSLQGKEKMLAWMQCHILSHLHASDLGVPSLLQDDWVTLQADHMVAMDIPKSVLQMLAISRFVNKTALLMGHSPHSPTGQVDGLIARPAWDGLCQDLVNLERSITADSLVSYRLELAKVGLHAFGLQSAITVEDRAEISSRLYTACSSAIQLASRSDPGPWIYWPKSASRGVFTTAIVLARLVSSIDGASFDLNLMAMSSAYRLLIRMCYMDGDQRENDTQLLLVAARDAQARRAEGRLYGGHALGDQAEVKSRMGIANYLHDCIASAKRMVMSHNPPTQTVGPFGTRPLIVLPTESADAVPRRGLGDWASQYLGGDESGDLVTGDWTDAGLIGFGGVSA